MKATNIYIGNNYKRVKINNDVKILTNSLTNSNYTNVSSTIANSPLKEVVANGKVNNRTKDNRIKYYNLPSLWDPNYDSALYTDRSLFTEDTNVYKNDSIHQLRVSSNPIVEFLHNRIVELIPLGIHNIWFHVLNDSLLTDKFNYSDLGVGTRIEYDWNDIDLDINKMMRYITDLRYLCLDIIQINDVWCDQHEMFCSCIQFRGFNTYKSIGGTVDINDIQDFYSQYTDREFIFSYPFSDEQTIIRKSFDARIQEYFSGKYAAREFNSHQERPIQQYIKEYLDFEEVRYSHKMTHNESNLSAGMRTYEMSFHMEQSCWNSMIEKDEIKYKHNHRIYFCEEVELRVVVSIEQSSALVLSEQSSALVSTEVSSALVSTEETWGFLNENVLLIGDNTTKRRDKWYVDAMILINAKRDVINTITSRSTILHEQYKSEKCNIKLLLSASQVEPQIISTSTNYKTYNNNNNNNNNNNFNDIDE